MGRRLEYKKPEEFLRLLFFIIYEQDAINCAPYFPLLPASALSDFRSSFIPWFMSDGSIVPK